MDEKLNIERFSIRSIANGYTVRVDYEEDSDNWKDETFYFSTVTEVIAFLETNLD